MPDLHYAPGSGLLLVASDAALVLAAGVTRYPVDELLGVLRTDPEPLQGIVTVLSDGTIDFARLPAFALLAGREPDRRLLLRGPIRADLDGEALTGDGVGSWLEVAVAEGTVVTVNLDTTAGATLPIRDGAVFAGMVIAGPLRTASGADPVDQVGADDARPPSISSALPHLQDYDHLFIDRPASVRPRVAPESSVPVEDDSHDEVESEMALGPSPIEDLGHLRGTLPLGDHDGRTLRAPGSAGSPWGIEVSTGERIVLGSRTVIGRRPIAPLADERERVRLVRVPSPSSDVSRSHVEIASRDGEVIARDLGSTNGTVLVRRGVRRRVGADEPVEVEADDVLDLGDGVTVRFVAES